jgi:hypothetical protein
MAARKNKIALTDEWREKIRISQIINRLNQGFFGEVELTSEQIRIADMLLKKVAPDLGRTELTGEGGGAIQLEATATPEQVEALKQFALLKYGTNPVTV